MKMNPSKSVNELISVISFVTDIEENRKLYHCWRVATISSLIAQDIVTIKKLKEIFYAASLFDIGGVGFPHHILYYLKRNDKASQNILLSHPIIGAQLVSNIPKLTPVAKLILDHHEWINGQGYPRAKTKKNIPLGSQIIRLADSIDIALQTRHFHKLSDLKTYLSGNVNKEFSKILFNHCMQVLGNKNTFNRLADSHAIPEIFNETREKVGLINVPRRIDAVGNALEIIAQIIDMKHPYTSGHSLRVSRYAMSIALAMNMDHEQITKIKWAGLIHDLGKVTLPRRILDKAEKLTPEEYIKVKQHAGLTREILHMAPSLKEIIPIAADHHEHFDGLGYPEGLKGEDIPLGARILKVCDAFDAMTSNRPYRKPLSPQEACKELEKYSGKQFDPKIVKQAIPLFRNLGI